MNVAGRRRRRRMAERAHLQWKGCLFHFVCLMFDIAFVLSVFLLYLCLHCLMQGEEIKRQVLLDRDLKPLLALQSTYNIPQCDNYLSQLFNIQLDKYRCLHSKILQKGTKIGFNFICLYGLQRICPFPVTLVNFFFSFGFFHFSLFSIFTNVFLSLNYLRKRFRKSLTGKMEINHFGFVAHQSRPSCC